VKQTMVYVAADSFIAEPAKTYSILRTLSNADLPFGIKINLDFLLEVGYGTAICKVRQFARPIFVDLKMMNGKRTMIDVAKRMVDYEVAYFNLMALADTQIPDVVEVTKGTETKVLGVTVLTHFDEGYCDRHFERTLGGAVRHLAEIAIERGCHGIILPGTTLQDVSDLETIKGIPGVRPKWYRDTRHEQEIQPFMAQQEGADFMVCGKPIMTAEDPVKALRLILSEIE
jgi:orotidine-5'-phosphate decarboxylase